MIEVRCNRQPWRDGVDVAIIHKIEGRVSFAEPLTLREVKQGEWVEPAITLENQEAQLLMDELWAVRASSKRGNWQRREPGSHRETPRGYAEDRAWAAAKGWRKNLVAKCALI